MKRQRGISRRHFLGAAGLGIASAGCSRFGGDRRIGSPVPADRKMRIACIGCGGKGLSDITGVSSEEIVGLCDVDDEMAKKAWEKHPQAKRYRDYRKMLVELNDKIDAVTVSTPDHTHFPAAMMAIEMGKHVFVQKPLTHTLWEARQLTLAARRHEVVTQMGNQGHALEGVRLVKEWVDSGALGNVEEVHIWTQKLQVNKYKSALKTRPTETPPVPETLDWNLWIGTSPFRPYSDVYHPRKWRNWWDFGCGALGDIGCHTMDAAFYALQLGAPESVEAETAPFNDETYPDWSVITYRFPARGKLPPVKLVWHDGGKVPERPKDLESDRKFIKANGYYMVGDKATVYDPTEKCQSPRIVPESKMRELAPMISKKTIPRVPEGNHFKEWINGCKGGPRPGSNFDYAGPLTEMVLLGNLAIRAGKKIEWDAKNLRCPNAPELDRYIKMDYRKIG